ncbi:MULTISPECIES: dCMP deaminase [unclassified Streptomyces]|uniref:dCMP deaminase n=1 Tax=unclassified Streptomyces TaxID=2593676 RepID=UPI00381176D6
MTDDDWMRRAIDLSRLCPPAEGAYSVGAILVDAAGQEIARGYSRESDPHVHAEESAFVKVAGEDVPRLAGATLYSTLEPCSERRSSPVTCTEHVLASPVRRVVIAWREPTRFVDCVGVERLREAGVEVLELVGLADEARGVNAHLL